MKLKFKVQAYQTNAVMSVVDCFAGQQNTGGIRYRFDPGKQDMGLEYAGFKNADLQITDADVLTNIRTVQRLQNLPISEALVSNAVCKVNLDIEMETGTGKTYCYIKTIFELNKRYGWSKFIIVVPSIAIREGVKKSLEITADHFLEEYHKKARFFIYNSKDLTPLESFSQDAGINVMVINIQAFNATGAENRRIYGTPVKNAKGETVMVGLDDFQSRKPIDVISSNRPILILDEPQKMGGARTLTGLAHFKPLMVLRYSATHVVNHNKVHRLDALDAYNQKLVKKIVVRGITVKGLAGTTAYLYLEAVEVSPSKPPVARLEIEVRQDSGIKPKVLRLGKGKNLYDESNEMDQYKGFVISQIDANTDTVEFTNGTILHVGDALGDVTEMTMRRIQIREAVKAHLEREIRLFAQGIKTLSLFFIDSVANYRDYGQPEDKGEYARIFEEEYSKLTAEYLSEIPLDNTVYRKYLTEIAVGSTHSGYFSIDKKSKRLTDPSFKARGEDAGLSDDVDAYDLILKDKERLLSFEEPVRFIFSHSALREGWDNPNVFVMCMLKHSDNSISRRQEVGRGLRLAVNRDGDRMDNPETTHHINVLTVVVSESYKEFVTNLQSEISASLSARPRVAEKTYFVGKMIQTPEGAVTITPDMATGIQFYLIANHYVDRHLKITDRYHADLKEGKLAEFPEDLHPHTPQIVQLINGLFSDAQLPAVGDDRKPKPNPLNANFSKQEFKALWERINHKAVYQVAFDTEELIRNSIPVLDAQLRVTPLQYIVQSGTQKAQISDTELKDGAGFKLEKTTVETHSASVNAMVTYDLLGKLADNTQLTRKTIASILSGIQPSVFGEFKKNPEHFISEASRLIKEQKATMIVEHIAYDTTDDTFDTAKIFPSIPLREDLSLAGEPLKKHIRDYVITDSKVERAFVTALDTFEDVVVYSKLPRGFFIPTPVGDYNPDWAIAFREGKVKHIYFVAETKGSLSTLELRGVENAKIECAKRFFEEVNRKLAGEKVKYDVVKSWENLLALISGIGEKAALPQAAEAAVLPFRPQPMNPEPSERYVTCLPLIPLQAAAGAFGDPQHILDGEWDWVKLETQHKLRPGMFVAQVIGKSMEPLIPDGAYCLFRDMEGTRQGKVVLVLLRDALDAETNQRFTVKQYASEKAVTEDGWSHEKITLKPRNPDFAAMEFLEDADGGLDVVAEFVEVLGG